MSDDGGLRRFTVPPEQDGERLDRFLTGMCPDLSRSRIVTDMSGTSEPAAVTVDGRPRAKNHRLRAGQEVVYRLGERQPLLAVAQDIPLDVIYEDAHLLVVNKPAGMVVHPAGGHPDGTLVNAVLHRQGGLMAGDDVLRPGIVHRLDKDTTGLLVVALTEAAHRHLSAQLKDRRMGRVYLALSWGRWDADAGELKGAIGRHPRRRQQMAVTAAGRAATTRYSVIEYFDFVQLCRVELETGRTHQIRVHFAHHNHPVVGDPVYGDDRRARGLQGRDRQRADRMLKETGRQLLHAAELHLEHPDDGRALVFTAPPPPDMEAVLARLRDGG